MENEGLSGTASVDCTSASATTETIPIAPWERYMALDYGKTYSMTCLSRFWFLGDMPREEFAHALAELAQANPLVAAKWTGKGWVCTKFDEQAQLDWADSSTPIDYAHLRPDEHLLQFIVRTGDLGQLGLDEQEFGSKNGALLTVKFPHAIADGKGILSLVNQLRLRFAGQPIHRTPQEHMDLRLHGGLTRLQRAMRCRWDAIRIFKYFFRRPIPFRSPDLPKPSEATGNICCTRVVESPAWTATIHAKTKEVGVQFNDLLIACLFRVLSRRLQRRGTIRIAVPVAMRPPDNEAVSNLVSMVFMDRRASQLDSPDFITGIADEMRLIKDRNLGHAMHTFLLLAGVGRGVLMRLFLSRIPTCVTAVLSNLGRPYHDIQDFTVGRWQLLQLDAVPPIRPGTNIAICANRFKDRFSLTIRYDGRELAECSAQAILKELLSECEQYAEGLSGKTPRDQNSVRT